MIKLIRLSDSEEFIIDGDDKEWRETKIEGIDALTVNVYTETPAIGSGEIVTGKYTGRRDISVTAHRSSLNGIPEARNAVMDFFDPDDTYTMEIIYNGKHLFIDCELLAYKLPTENIHRPLDLTFTMLCPDPRFYTEDHQLKISQGMPRFFLRGQFEIIPTITIVVFTEHEFNIYIDTDNDPIHIIFPDGYSGNVGTMPGLLELDCQYGTLTNKRTNEDLTDCIISGNPTLRLKPGTDQHYARVLSNKRTSISDTLTITSYYEASATFNQRLRELEVIFSDGHKECYDCSKNVVYSYLNYKIRIKDSGFVFNGQTGSSIRYTAILTDPSPNRSIATIEYRELYRGF